MKLTQMRYFSAVCHLGTVTRAAERLHISQPAVTAAVQALENELGVLLLSRGGRSLVPTPDGEAFLQRCDAILAEMDSLTAAFQARSGLRHDLTVGMPPMTAYFLFPKIFAEFTGGHPEIRIRPTEVGSDTAREMVRSGELDLAIIAMGDTPPAALEAQMLLRSPMRLIKPPKYEEENGLYYYRDILMGDEKTISSQNFEAEPGELTSLTIRKGTRSIAALAL